MTDLHVLRDADGELPPRRFTIVHDDYHAEHVGRTADGFAFFITTPFEWAVGGSNGREYVARYLFEADGSLRDATVVEIAPRPADLPLPGNVYASGDQAAVIEQLLGEIAPYELGDIEIQPFRFDRDGTEFGMVLQGPLEGTPDEEWYWYVCLQPGDFMAFHAPWDDGDYDT
ncbi:hypothetical protein HQQ81_18895 [Microbacteriaceae bacterium VKM Ac-2854]|nr:hypothetical protein [Microbacteriaceae bacterium VKM Ac-2854]